MAVVLMKKIRLVAHRDTLDQTLQLVQRTGAIELQPLEDTDLTEVPEVSFPFTQFLPQLNQVVAFLNQHSPVPSRWRSLREGSQIELQESDLAAEYRTVPEFIQQVVSEIEVIQQNLAEARERERQIYERIQVLQSWQGFTAPLTSLRTARTITYLVQHKASGMPTKTVDSFADRIRHSLALAEIPHEVTEITPEQCVVTIYRSVAYETSCLSIIKTGDGEVVDLVGEGTIAVELELENAALQQSRQQVAELTKTAQVLAEEHGQILRVWHDVLVWYQERTVAVNLGRSTRTVVVFEGWMIASELPVLTEQFEQSGLLAALTEIEPVEGDEPPVEISNHPLIQPFEVVTRLYGLPGHRDLDPTVFLAGFFFLYVGLSLTDVGYGVFLLFVALLIIFYFKVSPTVKLFGKLLALMGTASILVGLLFGGYLGVDPAVLPATLQALQQFDPIGNPLPVFYLALGLGVVQVMFGMLLRIYSEARNGRLLDGVLDQGPWLVLFVALIMYGAAWFELGLVGYGQELLLLVYGAVVAVVVSSGRAGRTILEKIQLGLLSIYNSIGYFSDILSYSRLLALGLATTALAFAVNLIAEIVRDAVPYVGVLLAIIVLIIGHTFNLAVNTLGAFIHSARLQFVEFFGKFISGTGRVFKPLRRSSAYVTVVDEKK